VRGKAFELPNPLWVRQWQPKPAYAALVCHFNGFYLHHLCKYMNYYSFIDKVGTEGWVGWPIVDSLPKVVTCQPWIGHRSGKVRWLDSEDRRPNHRATLLAGAVMKEKQLFSGNHNQGSYRSNCIKFPDFSSHQDKISLTITGQFTNAQTR